MKFFCEYNVGVIAENEGGDAPPGSRFSAVIEKIERLCMGKNSSDEEDLNDIPDDEEYDIEDYFIDDAELHALLSFCFSMLYKARWSWRYQRRKETWNDDTSINHQG
ncbi:hypothetical protein HanPI659440_Chr11g0432421 [Helianthus annuus]|nr:hypothetical protein HanPI659440_Chr11g0432421 [Helianthus annuus]